ncbi:MAG: acyl carrier protein [Bacteroidota bacterium]
MRQHFSKIKKAVEVFHMYGIYLHGPRKNDHFIQKMNMDPVFVNGLIFELEYQLQVNLQEEKLKNAGTPKALIDLLLDLPHDN